jgi:peptide/nickel transport system permease protein
MRRSFRFRNLFPILWLIFFTIGIFFAHLHAAEIETHLLTRVLTPGNDAFGRNCFWLTLETAYRSVALIFPIGVICLFTALIISFVSTLRSPKVQFAYHTFLDTFASLPGFLIALSFGIFMHSENELVMIAAVLMVLPYLVRFFESQLIHLSAQDYIVSARALGGSSFHIFTHHLVPDLTRSLIAIGPSLITRLLVIDTSLAFLGIKLSSTHETWGHLLYQGKDYLVEAPWILLISGVPLVLTLFSFHLLSAPQEITS